MKIRILAVLMLSAVSLAQTATPAKPNSNQPQASAAAAPGENKANCPCCQKMADMKDATGCCAHHDGAAKSEMSCCQGKDGKDAMSCAKADKDKSADACCSGGKGCNMDQKASADKSSKDTEHTAMACCGGSSEHCGMSHHDHGEMSK